MTQNKGIGLSGLNWATLKKNPAILPIYGLVGAAVCLAAGYVIRLATKNPEVTWSRNRNPEPWNAYANKQYKFVDVAGRGEHVTPAPDYRK